MLSTKKNMIKNLDSKSLIDNFQKKLRSVILQKKKSNFNSFEVVVKKLL